MRLRRREPLAFLLQEKGRPFCLFSAAFAIWLGCCRRLGLLVQPPRALWMLERSDQLISFFGQPLFAVLFVLHVGLVCSDLVWLQLSKVCHSSLEHTGPFDHQGLFDLVDRQRLCSIHLQHRELVQPMASFELHLVLEFEASYLSFSQAPTQRKDHHLLRDLGNLLHQQYSPSVCCFQLRIKDLPL